MLSSINKLLNLGGAALGPKPQRLNPALYIENPILADELSEMLRHKNGFYAFESALHVFPAGSTDKETGIDAWNSRELWINNYHGMADKCIFFAEDIFGGQFCLKSNAIYTFDPETGDLEFFAHNLNEWAEYLIQNYAVVTGYPLAHEWQKKAGALTPGSRLVPKIPFVIGGAFDIDNLAAISSLQGMRWRAELAVQIKDLPEGASVKLTIIE